MKKDSPQLSIERNLFICWWELAQYHVNIYEVTKKVQLSNSHNDKEKADHSLSENSKLFGLFQDTHELSLTLLTLVFKSLNWNETR